MSKQARMYVVFAAVAVAAYIFGMALLFAPSRYSWMLFVLPIVVSPVSMAVMCTKMERLPISTAGGYRTQPWSFMYGDSIFLPIALYAIGLGYRNIPDGFFNSGWWAVLSLLAGVGAGVGFHVMDSSSYRAQGAADALLAPTKIWHDLVVYPVLFDLLFMGGIPQLLPNAWSVWTLVALSGVVAWGVLGVYFDQKRQLNPFDTHPLWNAEQFTRIN